MSTRALILASSSPRRRELLAGLLDDFRIETADIPEPLTDDAIADAQRLARAKADAIAARHPGALIIAADTIVFDEERSYGKPDGPDEAIDMLAALAGRVHRVVTAVSVRSGGESAIATSVASVRLRPLTSAEIGAYVATGSPLDKAGAYAIQDADGPVESYDGCFCGIMGLPMWQALQLLDQVGVAVREPAATFPRCAECPERIAPQR